MGTPSPTNFATTDDTPIALGIPAEFRFIVW
jgi:hypothetical protein